MAKPAGPCLHLGVLPGCVWRSGAGHAAPPEKMVATAVEGNCLGISAGEAALPGQQAHQVAIFRLGLPLPWLDGALQHHASLQVCLLPATQGGNPR